MKAAAGWLRRVATRPSRATRNASVPLASVSKSFEVPKVPEVLFFSNRNVDRRVKNVEIGFGKIWRASCLGLVTQFSNSLVGFFLEQKVGKKLKSLPKIAKKLSTLPPRVESLLKFSTFAVRFPKVESKKLESPHGPSP